MSKEHKERPNSKNGKEVPPKDNTEEKQEKYMLYSLLQVSKEATSQQIRTSYKKLVMVYHPDKNKGDQNARQKFQKLKEAYDILIDKQKRSEYDETGFVGDELGKQFQSAYEYFRKMYKKVTEEDIVEFEKGYRNGQMEEQDLLDYYKRHDGDMVMLLESIPLSRNQDVSRFIRFFEEKIAKKELQKTKKFTATQSKVRLLVDESKEFQQEMKKQKDKGMKDLMLQIRNKNSKNDFITGLEEKYGVGKKKKAQKIEKKDKP